MPLALPSALATCMRWPDRSSAILIVAVGASAFWFIASVLGLHPDGAVLGFSGTMWAVWATTEKEARREQARRSRRPDRGERK